MSFHVVLAQIYSHNNINKTQPNNPINKNNLKDYKTENYEHIIETTKDINKLSM